MPPYPRKKDLPPQNSLLTPVTGAAGQVTSYTPFMLFVCQQRKLIEKQIREGTDKRNYMESQSNNKTRDDQTENSLTDSQNFRLLSNNFDLGVKFSNGWKELDNEKKSIFTQAAGTERIRRRLQRIYAKSWVESAKQTRESNAVTSADVMLRLREMDQESRNIKNRWVKFGSKNTKSSATRKNKSLQRKKTTPRLKRKEAPKGPQKPKNPVSAFQFYTREVRDSIREQNPGINGPELAKIIGNKWKKKTGSERSIYVKKQNKDKIRFTKELETFLKNHPEFSEKYEKKKRKKTNTGNGKTKSNPSKILRNDSDATNNSGTAFSGKGNQSAKIQGKCKVQKTDSDSIVSQDKILKASGNGT